MNSSNSKVWYKQGWGLVAAILLFPLFIIWYTWAKSNWTKNVKIGITVAILVIVVITGTTKPKEPARTSSQNSPPFQSKTTTPAPAKTQEAKPVPVFDVPSLVGKNIDEARKVLGTPLDKDPEPTQQQIERGADEWYNGYKKDGLELTITFNPTTRKITDFFLGGSDKGKLMQQGNLQENQSTYRIEAVKVLRGVGITGIKAIPQ